MSEHTPNKVMLALFAVLVLAVLLFAGCEAERKIFNTTTEIVEKHICESPKGLLEKIEKLEAELKECRESGGVEGLLVQLERCRSGVKELEQENKELRKLLEDCDD